VAGLQDAYISHYVISPVNIHRCWFKNVKNQFAFLSEFEIRDSATDCLSLESQRNPVDCIRDTIRG